MIFMDSNMRFEKEKTSSFSHTIIIDSTIIIHLKPSIWGTYKQWTILIPEKVKLELKSNNAKNILAILDSLPNISFISPSAQFIKRAKELAKRTGDITRLSSTDISVIALALEFPGSKVASDDKAIQNVCLSFNIPIEAKMFKIKSLRQYYWKCIVCKTTFTHPVALCPECGSPVKRHYKKKSLG